MLQFADHAKALWHRLVHVAEAKRQRERRDGAILLLLETDPDDALALTLARRALEEGNRSANADQLAARLDEIARIAALDEDDESSAEGRLRAVMIDPELWSEIRVTEAAEPPTPPPRVGRARDDSGALHWVDDSDVVEALEEGRDESGPLPLPWAASPPLTEGLDLGLAPTDESEPRRPQPPTELLVPVPRRTSSKRGTPRTAADFERNFSASEPLPSFVADLVEEAERDD